MDLIGGVWLLDTLNILKYQGVDIFDSIVNVSPGTWCILLFASIILGIIMGLISSKFN